MAITLLSVIRSVTLAQDDSGNPRFFSYVDGLHLRDTPKYNGKVLGVLPRGLLVPLVELEEKPAVVNGIRNRWIKVKHGSIEGWAFGGYMVWHKPRDGEKMPRTVSIEKTSIPVLEWPSLKNAVVLIEPQKGVLYLDAADSAPLYRNQPRGVIPLEKSFDRKTGLKSDFANTKTLFFKEEKYQPPGDYGATGYILFTHPDHGKVWVADCHAHQVADTLKHRYSLVLLGTSYPIWEGDRRDYRLMIWSPVEKKFVYGTLPFPKVAYSYARASFLFSNEKDGAYHLQVDARNETNDFDPSGDTKLINPFYNLFMVVTESKVVELNKYRISGK